MDCGGGIGGGCYYYSLSLSTCSLVSGFVWSVGAGFVGIGACGRYGVLSSLVLLVRMVLLVLLLLAFWCLNRDQETVIYRMCVYWC